MAERSCPRCTLLTRNQDATTCELCGAALPRLGPPASAQPKVTGKRKQPAPDAKQRGIAAFFGGGGNGAGRGAPAAAPSAVSAAPSTAASVPSVPHAAPTPARQAVAAAVRPACHGRRAAARPEPAARAVPTASGGLATGYASAVRARRGCARRRLSYTLTAGKGARTQECDARAARAGRVRRGSGGAVLPPLTCQGCAVGGPPASPRLVDRPACPVPA